MNTAEARRLSKALFGNVYRLEIAAAVGSAKTEIVTAKDLATDLGVPPNLVGKQLKDFVTAGVMADVPKVEGQRSRYFRRLDNPYWNLAAQLLASWRTVTVSASATEALPGQPNINPTSGSESVSALPESYTTTSMDRH